MFLSDKLDLDKHQRYIRLHEIVGQIRYPKYYGTDKCLKAECKIK